MLLTRAGHSERSRGCNAANAGGEARLSIRRAALSYRRGILRPRKLSGLRMTRGCGPTDPTAADYNVAIVNYRGLTRSDRALRVVQTNSGAIIFQRRHCRNRSGMIIANLDRRFDDGISLQDWSPLPSQGRGWG